MMSEAEELAEKLMVLPRAIVEQQRMNSKIIVTLIEQQERIVQLICNLHDIDMDELRKEILS